MPGKLICTVIAFMFIVIHADAQDNAAKKDTAFKPSGKFWGNAFGDFYYKQHADSLNRGGANQYTGIEKNRNAFQLRRVYFGYNYDFSKQFAAELLLAAEDNINNSAGVSSGDLLSDNKLAFYIKLANVRWKNIWKGTDLVVGQVATPAFPLLTESFWGYRSVERTVADIRRTPSFDLGAALQGKFDPETANYGYNLMVGNGTGARPEGDKFKTFYGDIWAKFMDKKLVLDLYSDYSRLSLSPGRHRSRNMIKGFIGYTIPAITVGAEAFINKGENDIVGTKPSSLKDTLSATSKAVSLFVRGRITKEKLGFFARVDRYNPYSDHNNQTYSSFKGLTSNYEPNNKELFITAGLDFTPIKNVHFMPNVWYNKYTAQQENITGLAKEDHDLVYRLTFYYVFGK